MVIANIKKEDSKKAFKKEAVFKVPKIKGYPMIRIEKGCVFREMLISLTRHSSFQFHPNLLLNPYHKFLLYNLFLLPSLVQLDFY